MTEVTFTVVGTEAELDGFMRYLDYEVDLQITGSSKEPLRPGDEARLGEHELMQLLLSFATSVAGSAVYDQVTRAFERYSAKRSHMRLESPDTADPSSSSSEAPPG